ncbi:hypothetical protein [Isoptericola sp. BMS4]|uniref:hypothetical protein n=1 Tax=Isoptericola sp. BMS4 TaxID=2527875 RepID=UPI001423D611|nr:hypothetical protein [Isoptericola sp. BMS4]
MGFLDRLLGRTRDERSFHGVPGRSGHAPHTGEAPDKYGYAPEPGQEPFGPPATPGYGASGGGTAGGGTARRDPDEVAVERYRYLLRTAPPDAVEQAHAEAFARLTPEQRRRVLDELGAGVPPAERATSDDPRSLARMATRAEMREPGTLERSFRQDTARGPGFGSMVGSSLLGTVAGVVIGSAVANALFGPAFGDPTQDLAGDASDTGADSGDTGADAGSAEAGAPDDGGGFGDFLGGDGGFDVGGF